MPGLINPPDIRSQTICEPPLELTGCGGGLLNSWGLPWLLDAPALLPLRPQEAHCALPIPLPAQAVTNAYNSGGAVSPSPAACMPCLLALRKHWQIYAWCKYVGTGPDSNRSQYSAACVRWALSSMGVVPRK